MTKIKFQSEKSKQGVILKFDDTNDFLLITLAVVSSKGLISQMEGSWQVDYVADGVMNIDWGVPKMQMENVLNSNDFRLLSQKGVNAATNYCRDIYEKQ